MRRFATAALLVTLIGGLTAACSDKKDDTSSTSKGATTTTQRKSAAKPGDSEFVTKVLGAFTGPEGEGMLDEKDARCTAESLDENMSDAAKATFDKADSKFEDLAEDDQAAFVKAFDDCVKLETLITSLSKSLGLDTKAGDCVAGKLKEKFDSSGAFMRAVATDADSLPTLYQDCVPGAGVTPGDATAGTEGASGDIGTELQRQLEASGITAQQAACVSGKLQSRFTSAELTALANEPSKIVEAMAPISKECGIGN